MKKKKRDLTLGDAMKYFRKKGVSLVPVLLPTRPVVQFHIKEGSQFLTGFSYGVIYGK